MSMDIIAPECLLLAPEWEKPLTEFFETLVRCGDDKFFHPHPFTAEESHRRCYYAGEDLYYILVLGKQILGYGMLRGWDEGHARPSLGIVIHPDARGKGLGKVLMYFLHVAARFKGADEIRLKVYPENVKAIQLYQALGYKFNDQEAGQWVGIVSLHD
jgi:[ribosomal protein S18]-alanine N-acetyltransferase